MKKIFACFLTLGLIVGALLVLCITSAAADVAVVTTSDASDRYESFKQAVVRATANEGSQIMLLTDVTVTPDEDVNLSGTFTIDTRGHKINVTSPLTVTGGKVTFTDSARNVKGGVYGTQCTAIKMTGGEVRVMAGNYRSNTGAAIENQGTGVLTLSGTPSIRGEGSDIYLACLNTLETNNGKPYEGTRLTVLIGANIVPSKTDPVLSKTELKDVCVVTSSNLSTTVVEENGNLYVLKIAIYTWVLFGVILAVAALFIILTIVFAAKHKKKMQTYSFLPLPLLVGVFVTQRQKIALVVAGAICLLAFLIFICTLISQKKKEKAAKEAAGKKAPKQEAPDEEPVTEDAPTEEEPAEEPAAEEEAPAEEEPTEEPAAEEEAPAEEEAAEEEAEEATEGGAIVDGVAVAGSATAYSMYKKSFTARMIQAPTEVQERYGALKNALLSYKKVNARVSWSYESFKSGRTQLAKFAIRGKTLCLFLSINPDKLEGTKYNIDAVGGAKKYETVPCRLRLTSKRSVKWGLELIAMLAEQEGLVANPKFQPQSYTVASETDEALIEKGLIKKV